MSTENKLEPEFRLRALPPMDAAQFRLWADLLEQRTGMRLPESRKSFLVTSLGARMRQLGFHDYGDYYRHVRAGRDGKVEWDRLVDHLTVHETRFFRHLPTLELIREEVVPAHLARAGGDAQLHVWSVGCATGEEPYSIAMVLDHALRQAGRERAFGITASDISRTALAAGRKGIYGAAQVKDVPPEYRRSYLRRLSNRRWQVVDSLRQRVCFNHLNILDLGRSPIGPMDLIVCQNLLIYYERPRRQEIAAILARYLAPGGVLVLGVGELLRWEHPRLRRIKYPNTLAYRRSDTDDGLAS